MNSTTIPNQKQVQNSDATMSKPKSNTTELQTKEAELFNNLLQLTKTLNLINQDLIETFGYQGDIVGPEGLIEYTRHDGQYEIKYTIMSTGATISEKVLVV